MLKVLHLNTYSWGGAAKASIRLHKALLKSGVQSKILFLEQDDYNIPKSVCFKDYLASQKLFKKLLQKVKKRYKVYQQSNRLKAIDGNPNLFKFSYSPYRVETHPLFQWADIIHLHWVSDFINPLTFLRELKQPLFWTFHDLQAISGGYHYKSSIDLEQYNSLLKQNQAINKLAFTDKKIYAICPSEWMLEEVRNRKVISRIELFHLLNGIDPTIFSPISKEVARDVLNLSMRKKIILFIAGNLFDQRKGLFYLLEAFSALKNKNSQLVVVGNKYEHELPEAVHYLGNIRDERLMRLVYAAADVTVVPSLADNLPNTALESILCGTPLLANRIGGLTEILNHKNGLLCDVQKINEFSKKLEAMLEKKFDPTSIHQDAKALYSDSIQVKRLLPLYKKSLTDV
ncbi:MAG: glycosyltransferase [Bacteroidota bacterium]